MVATVILTSNPSTLCIHRCRKGRTEMLELSAPLIPWDQCGRLTSFRHQLLTRQDPDSRPGWHDLRHVRHSEPFPNMSILLYVRWWYRQRELLESQDNRWASMPFWPCYLLFHRTYLVILGQHVRPQTQSRGCMHHKALLGLMATIRPKVPRYQNEIRDTRNDLCIFECMYVNTRHSQLRHFLLALILLPLFRRVNGRQFILPACTYRKMLM